MQKQVCVSTLSYTLQASYNGESSKAALFCFVISSNVCVAAASLLVHCTVTAHVEANHMVRLTVIRLGLLSSSQKLFLSGMNHILIHTHRGIKHFSNVFVTVSTEIWAILSLLYLTYFHLNELTILYQLLMMSDYLFIPVASWHFSTLIFRSLGLHWELKNLALSCLSADFTIGSWSHIHTTSVRTKTRTFRVNSQTTLQADVEKRGIHVKMSVTVCKLHECKN